MRDDRERLAHILEAIGKIEDYAERGRDAFTQDELLQVWCVHHIGIIGEAARNLSPALREQHPEIPWNDIVGMRNILVHEYFGVDLDEVWDTIESDLPDLKVKMESILKKLGE
ncbi:MAG: DUF86 domain-containing protein [bacterium]